jgi:signal transduction histidine kinase/CheY-like chemotaxis protein
LALAFANPSASPVWPPTGIALGVTLLLGARMWPAIFAGAFLVNFTSGSSPATALAIAAGNTGEALLGAALVRQFANGPHAFQRTQDVLAFVVLGGLAGTTLSATAGVTSLAVAGEVTSAELPSVWLTWWLGNAAGAVIVAPLVILWSTRPRFSWTSARWAELALLACTVAVVSWIVFVESSLRIEFLAIPLCVWAGARFGAREAATVTALLSGLAVWATVGETGPFADPSRNTGLLVTQSFMVVAQLVGLGIAAALSELRIAHEDVRRLNEALEERVAERTAELQSSEARLAEAQEVAQIGSWEWDVLANEVWWSDELYRTWRTSRHAFQPTYDAFLAGVHPDDRVQLQSAIERAKRDGHSFDEEHRITPFGGDERIVRSKGRVIRDADGRVVRMVGTAQDVTEYKRLEAQFQQAQKLEALGLLAGGIAHDFNNLITAIGGYTELVLVEFDGRDSRRNDLFEVRKAADRAAALTRRLLAFSRPQSIQPKMLDINALVAGIETLLRRTIGEHIELVLDLDAGVECIRADAAQLEHVLLNLALNARDAMPDGGRLRFATALVGIGESEPRPLQRMTPGNYVKLTVSDTGIGMSPETQARIFEPFFTTKPAGEGTGFGLATAYSIIKQCGGYISVSSALGSGTTFDIYLPTVLARSDTRQPSDELTCEAGGSETILLVEDDGAVRRLARIVLSSAGYHVLDARDGEEALVLVAGRKAIDLLISDVVMPGVSGHELSQRLAQRYANMRVLYTSGYTKFATQGSGIDLSAPFLPKPFRPADLLTKVREVLGRSGEVPVEPPAQ